MRNFAFVLAFCMSALTAFATAPSALQGQRLSVKNAKEFKSVSFVNLPTRSRGGKTITTCRLESSDGKAFTLAAGTPMVVRHVESSDGTKTRTSVVKVTTTTGPKLDLQITCIETDEKHPAQAEDILGMLKKIGIKDHGKPDEKDETGDTIHLNEHYSVGNPDARYFIQDENKPND